jgi:hypothetical protein
MSTMKYLVILAATALVVGTATARAAELQGEPPATPEDHAAAATAYEAEAKEAKRKAASHELMARRYRNAPTGHKGLKVPTTAMASHCQKLADSYGQAAVEASALAELHRAAADAPK